MYGTLDAADDGALAIYLLNSLSQHGSETATADEYGKIQYGTMED